MFRRGRCSVTKLKCAFLMRQSHVAANEALVLQAAEKTFEFVRPNFEPLVGALESEFFEPVIMDERRPRVLDGPAYHEGAWRRVEAIDHPARLPSLRKNARSGSRGKPSIVA